jgi:hypothetical protein
MDFCISYQSAAWILVDVPVASKDLQALESHIYACTGTVKKDS